MGPLLQQIAALKSGEVTSHELVEQCFEVIEAKSDYNAIISTRPQALEEARLSDSSRSAPKTTRRLEGVPFIVKDNLLTTGDEMTSGSNMLRGFVSPYTATAVQRLLDEGAILVAKSNMDSFGFGSSTENSDFGPTKNPIDPSLVPGGSSGGSAAAVALDMTTFAIGTDTAGSIRQPAAFTGTVGYKPTYGLVSRYGMTSMASSTDTVGVIARSTADAALVMDIMAGKDVNDSTTIDLNEELTSLKGADLSTAKVGVITDWLTEGVDPAIVETVESAVEALKSQGVEIVEVSVPELKYALSVYYIIMPAEVSSNLSRYDGVRYRHTAQSSSDLDSLYLKSRTEGFNEEAKRRIILGTHVLSSGYYDAYYKKAQQVRTLLINAMDKALSDVDFLLGPTTPTLPFKIGEKTADPMQMYLSDIMTAPSSLCGLPTICLPIAGSDQKLPVGMQLLAGRRQDSQLLNFANTIEVVLEKNK